MTTVAMLVDGEKETFTDLQFSMPNVVYTFAVPGEDGLRRVLGAWGFGVAVTDPSDRLLEVHAGRRACEVTLRSEGLELGPVVVIFDQLIENPGGRVLFGHSPHGDERPRWENIS